MVPRVARPTLAGLPAQAYGVSAPSYLIIRPPPARDAKRNVWADIGSRAELGGWDEMARLAAAAGLRVRRVGVPEGWRGVADLMMAAGADEH